MKHTLLFEAKAFLTLFEYARSVSTEICGIGRIQKDDFDIARVTQIAILPQEVGGADANVTATEMEAFFETIPEDERKEWCFNWHTHPTFSTSPSAVDLANYNNMNDLFDVFVPMIINKKGEYNAYSYYSFPTKMFGEIKKVFIYEMRENLEKFDKLSSQKDQIPVIEAVFEMLNLPQFKLSEEEKAFIFEEVTQKVHSRNNYAKAYNAGNYGAYNYSYRPDYGYDYDQYGNWQYKQNDQLRRHPQSEPESKIIVPGKESLVKITKAEKKLLKKNDWTIKDLQYEMEWLGYKKKEVADDSNSFFELFADNENAPKDLTIEEAIEITKLSSEELISRGLISENIKGHKVEQPNDGLDNELNELIIVMEDIDYDYDIASKNFYGPNGTVFTIEEAKEFVSSIKTY